MTGIRKNIWKHLTDRLFRREYVAEQARSGVAYQLKAMREARGWSQADLAKMANKSQSNIARLEDPDYGKFSLQTLLELSDAFDVWLSVEFVPFNTGLARTSNRSASALNAISFSDEMASSKPAISATSTAKLTVVGKPINIVPRDAITWRELTSNCYPISGPRIGSGVARKTLRIGGDENKISSPHSVKPISYSDSGVIH